MIKKNLFTVLYEKTVEETVGFNISFTKGFETLKEPTTELVERRLLVDVSVAPEDKIAEIFADDSKPNLKPVYVSYQLVTVASEELATKYADIFEEE